MFDRPSGIRPTREIPMRRHRGATAPHRTQRGILIPESSAMPRAHGPHNHPAEAVRMSGGAANSPARERARYRVCTGSLPTSHRWTPHPSLRRCSGLRSTRRTASETPGQSDLGLLERCSRIPMDQLRSCARPNSDGEVEEASQGNGGAGASILPSQRKLPNEPRISCG